ncbi:probable E3 ubiquitin-protein ligase HERC4 isoform X1 [Lingula anatina]|uniref:Probable E3 ubiquitin-protein ligase HERC4 isoform X1 n=1 Tax=Lingula anatina TaxID=7574 RepID=A0A1S3IH23_LINAN|nr:probable E3 ubiquitin-protein ligase HERC4 isoform X1 [Lingula anatina]XP_013397516.1 probable E3 ubiquitin-protein ligase HERC4 isoform X1 [Lingula anatina]XP_013397517.1 probable E3 ubiquitin-protein ligase HERC4 isoform X1 [Lingula anatina]|eukprot:XP_013397514.1 probable E3 ubiquitin-protein ligase HERC4 isoform X1 [Lingula anatina]
MTAVFCWGGASQGQLGLGGSEEQKAVQPQQLEVFQGREIQQISCGLEHTLIALKDGSLYSCGSNTYGQLGKEKSSGKPELVGAFETGMVRLIACGAYHNIAVTDSKQVYSWGQNSHGQLGRGEADKNFNRVPRLLKGFSASSCVIQVACGDKHTVILTRDGSIFVCGDHSHGQLGMGNLPQGRLDCPVKLKCMLGLPIGQIAAGGHHSFALTLSGTLFGWGKNNFGQLGLGDEKDRLFPTLAKSVRNQKIKYVCCGEDHSVLLTQEGGVFTFGAGSHGQLGHNSLNNELLPRKVFELMGSEVTQIASGRRHTLALVPLRGRVYSFGLGASGQLGTGNTSNCNSPSTVKGPWVPAVVTNGPSSSDSSMEVDDTKSEAYVIRTIYSGGDQCFMYTAKPDLHMRAEDFRTQKPHYTLLTLNEDVVERCVAVQKDARLPLEVTADLEMVFSSASCLNGSFLLRDNRHLGSSRLNHGIDFDAAQEIFQMLKNAPNTLISHQICATLEQKLLPSLPISPPDIEAIRLYLVLPFCHIFENPNFYSTIICPFGQSIISLDKVATKVIDQWWSKLRSRDFKKLVTIYKQCVVFILQEPHAKNEFEVLVRQKGLHVSMEILRKLYTVNDGGGQIIPYDSFYIWELKDKVDIRADYVNWIQSKGSGGMLSFCNFPFVFDAQAKTLLLHTDAVMQMQLAVDEVHRRNFSSLFIPTIDPVNPCLVLYIDRRSVVQDTINQLAKQGSTDFKKPLKVIMKGEEAVDAGGVRKEFFLLLLREILDPKYGMFRYYEESRMIWFNNKTFEDPVMFFLIGVLCGLAIYNNTIIDLPFPQALYKKLLKRPVVMDDLRELMPDVAKNMQELLDYEDDVQEAFCLNFVIVQDNFGEPEHIELIPDGANIDVTAENRHQYIDAYIDHIFNKSVQTQFEAFHTGFLKVCGGRVMDLFHPAELQAMVVGNENYDWEELEKTAEYKGEYWRNHHTIKIFWEVFREMTVSQKKKFLLFLTGSDRIPILGMKAVKIFIQPTGGGEDYLPVAHTCFNLLDLPKFTNKDKLRQKLLQAVEQSEGFGLV